MHKTQSEFEKDIIKGLTDYPKHLPSKYIYDKRGDKLFQEIMAMPPRGYPVYGAQFHPESILTTYGHQLLQNFLELPASDTSF